MATSIDDFGKEMQSILQTFAHNCETDLDKACEEVAKAGAKKLKATSPKGDGKHKGHYASGWTAKKQKNGQYVIHNRKKYQLTHLLKYGHDVVFKTKNGKLIKRGHAGAHPHIKAVEDEVIENLPEEFRKKVEMQK